MSPRAPAPGAEAPRSFPRETAAARTICRLQPRAAHAHALRCLYPAEFAGLAGGQRRPRWVLQWLRFPCLSLRRTTSPPACADDQPVTPRTPRLAPPEPISVLSYLPLAVRLESHLFRGLPVLGQPTSILEDIGSAMVWPTIERPGKITRTWVQRAGGVTSSPFRPCAFRYPSGLSPSRRSGISSRAS